MGQALIHDALAPCYHMIAEITACLLFCRYLYDTGFRHQNVTGIFCVVIARPILLFKCKSAWARERGSHPTTPFFDSISPATLHMPPERSGRADASRGNRWDVVLRHLKPKTNCANRLVGITGFVFEYLSHFGSLWTLSDEMPGISGFLSFAQSML